MSPVAERVDWLTAPPLWAASAAGALALDRPALLRFAGDDFMAQYQARLSHDDDLAAVVAVSETWDSPASGIPASNGTGAQAAGEEPVKLFQPAHGRFYLVAAGLVCGRYGLPDKTVAGQDQVAFVLRRLAPSGAGPVDPLDPGTHTELGWVTNGTGEGWRVATVPTQLVASEERLALFPTVVTRAGHRRRVLAGLIPVSGRERYESGAVGPAAPPTGDAAPPSADELLAEVEVIVGGMQAIRAVAPAATAAGAASSTARSLRHGLYFLLLDLAAWLDRAPGLRAQVAAHTTLDNPSSFAPGRSWLSAADAAEAGYAAVADLDPDANPPAPVAAMAPADAANAVAAAGVAIGSGASRVAVESTVLFQGLRAAVDEVTEIDPPPGPPPAPAAGRHVYVVRCIFERPACGPSHRLVMSRPSRPFVLAGFHDPDAPARPVIIPTPGDISVEGLRKFPKTVQVAVSKQLRAQTDRIRGVKLGDLDDGNIPGAPPTSLGMICSLSIPVITICALILLMIIVQLLNIVFFWMPYFQICRPKVD